MSSFAVKHSIYSDDQRAKIKEILKRVKADRIEMIRISFVDQHGVMRGKSFTPEMLPSLFENGMTVPSSLLLKDLSHRTVLPRMERGTDRAPGLAGIGDIILMPDPDRYFVLPWLKNTSWIQADIFIKTGKPLRLIHVA